MAELVDRGSVVIGNDDEVFVLVFYCLVPHGSFCKDSFLTGVSCSASQAQY